MTIFQSPIESVSQILTWSPATKATTKVSLGPGSLNISEFFSIDEHIFDGHFPKERGNPPRSLEVEVDWVVYSLTHFSYDPRGFQIITFDLSPHYPCPTYDGTPTSIQESK